MEAAFYFLIAVPLSGGGKGRAIKEKRPLLKTFFSDGQSSDCH